MKPGLFFLLLTLSIAALILSVIRFSNLNKATVSTQPTTQSPKSPNQEVSFETVDGSTISATLSTPDSDSPYKTIILIHEFNSTRHDFDFLVPTLLSKNYRVLSFDLRSRGLSKSSIDPQDPKFLDSTLEDLKSAIIYLKLLPDTDANNIAVVGVSIGANLAYVNSSLDTVKTSVAVSPSRTSGPLEGKNIENFSPKNIYFLSDTKDSSAAKYFFQKTSNPKSIKAYSVVSGQGIELLKNQQVQSDILNYLQESLN